MKNRQVFLLLTLGILMVVAPTKGQDSDVLEKSLFGIQTGFLGLWAHNESSLGKKLILRSEIGLDAGFGAGGAYNIVINEANWLCVCGGYQSW